MRMEKGKSPKYLSSFCLSWVCKASPIGSVDLLLSSNALAGKLMKSDDLQNAAQKMSDAGS